MLKRELPKSERMKAKMEFEKYKAEMDAMDERWAEIVKIDEDNTRYDHESMRLDMKEINNIYGEQQSSKD